MKGKYLGKITRVEYGLGGYQDAMMGLTVTLEGQGCDVTDFKGFWSISPNPNAQWDLAKQSESFAETTRVIIGLLEAAKVQHVGQLKGKPVEYEIDENNSIAGWRILTEVIA